MMNIRWGILGTGSIAAKFAAGLGFVEGAELAAVGSRSRATAEAFGDRFGIPRRFASYEDLACAPDLDVIYVATPHVFHHAHTLLCLHAGKAVLCEKPFTINAQEAHELVAYARQRGLFLMEAMWTRFFPALERLRSILAAGTIGEARMLMADIGFSAPFDPTNRLFDPALGGGALLDLGVYPVSLSSMLFGRPSRITALAHLGQTGVDEQAGIVLAHGEGQLSVLTAAIRTATPCEAKILGTRGQIEIAAPFWYPHLMTLRVGDGPPERIESPFVGNGYNHMAAEVGRCLRSGKLESDTMPLAESVAIMETLDAIRAQWGLRYPGED
ncbi:Gfo/Idh/MocA family oxidoreductase [Polyangium sp. y55x31]|uniref:Gfo/Idh/MocA family protein n=1 Tax=Polyangium sp. y55x31 TaxID=3042688 RepID=UPI002482C255|nr:Gfo/Idh/MocA family oxidoreductase [Polyangium sp. y55x31]MDI1477239.1 Gfo/Idh/MocA family oxidoreductase [Polyangium sp. y55x31]